MQCVVLGILAVTLYFMVEMSVNFDGTNASTVIKNEMPWHYHERFVALSLFLIVISIFSFCASFYEVGLMFSLDNLLCIIAILCCIILGIISGLAS